MMMDRRTFVGASCATAATALVGATVTGMAGEPETGAVASFLVAPEPYADDQIAEVIESEVVVVGGGPAGFFAAISAYEHGADVRIISMDPMASAHGGDYWGFNTKAMEANGVDPIDVDRLVDSRIRDNGYNVSESKWRVIAKRNGQIMDWWCEKMEAAGYRTIILPGYDNPDTGETIVARGTHQWVLEGQTLGTQGLGAIAVLESTAVGYGIPIDYETEAKQLVKDDAGRVVGVVAECSDGLVRKYLAAKGVILATGDYTGDHEMLEAFCPDMAKLGYGGWYAGEGHKMALWAGAAWQRTVPSGAMIGSLCGGAASVNDCLAFSGLIINERGERYSNELCASGSAALQQIRQPNRNAIAIWDRDYAEAVPGPWADSWARGTADVNELPAFWDSMVGEPVFVPGAPEQVLIKAETLEELAGQIAEAYGTDPQAILATIARYNELCAAGHDDDFGKSPSFMVPIDTPPFYARHGGVSFLIATGGVRTDDAMRVLDVDDEPIHGLYAAGTIVGDMFANYDFALGGIHLGGLCMTFGYVAGESVASA